MNEPTIIKFSAEIKNNEFEYSYEIGSSTQTASMPLTGDMFVCFANLLRLCQISWHNSGGKAAK